MGTNIQLGYAFPESDWYVHCGVEATGYNQLSAFIEVRDFSQPEEQVVIYRQIYPISYDRWYSFNIAKDPGTMDFCCLDDGQVIGKSQPEDADRLAGYAYDNSS